MSMTLLSLWMSDPDEATARLSIVAITTILVAASIKAGNILWVFLNLRSSTAAWRNGFIAFLAAIVGMVWMCAAIGMWLGR